MSEPLAIYDRLCEAMKPLSFSEPVTHTYNPLLYARGPLEQYLERFGQGPKEVILLGMNPGPWGTAQVGIPFGDIELVRDWMGIDGEVGKPELEHPKRPVEGFSCHRSDVSGRRLWGWARDTFGAPEDFFSRCLVLTYCPLSFMEAGGRNRTPDKLPIDERKQLFPPCDEALGELLAYYSPRVALGIGGFAEKCIKRVLGKKSSIQIGRILHPSPASPAANHGWAERATETFEAFGIL